MIPNASDASASNVLYPSIKPFNNTLYCSQDLLVHDSYRPLGESMQVRLRYLIKSKDWI